MKHDEMRAAHHWFAVECNNQSWDLTAKPNRSSEENREMLFLAYAAAYHWSKVGKPINYARANVLLAHVHSLLGQGELALQFARQSLDHCQGNPCEDWDLAFCHSEMAFAYSVLGNAELHQTHYDLAARLGESISEPEERRVFLAEFSRIPSATGKLPGN